MAAIRALDRSAGGLEYVEQPCATVEELAAVRRAVDVPIAADESIRRAADPYRVRDLEAADIAVLKVQPLGGVRACLRIAEDIGLPVVVSSALETSVGIAAGVALAAALPELPYACGLATVQLLTDDVVSSLPAAGRRGAAGRSGGGGRGGPRTPGRGAGARRRVGGPAGRGAGGAAGSPLVTTPSTELARAVVTALVEAGVTEVVLAPGSRNAPLAFAAYDAAEAGLLRLHTRIDERTAGFLALGLTRNHAPRRGGLHVGHRRRQPAPRRARGRPQLRCRSSSSPPTGPPGCAAPTRTRPPTTSASSVGWCRPSTSPHPPTFPTSPTSAPAQRPLHLNVQFDDPLVPDDRWVPEGVRIWAKPQGSPRKSHGLAQIRIPRARGPSSSPATTRARPPGCSPRTAAGRCSRSRAAGRGPGENALRCYRLLLDGELGRRIERAVVFGHPTLSRPVARLLARADVEVWAGPAPGVWAERPFPVDQEFERLEVDGSRRRAWLAEWKAADADVARRLDALLAAEGTTPYGVAGVVSRALPREGLLFVGASSPIRDLDLMVPKYEVGGRRKVIANRGLSGIDGTVSSAIGAALGRPRTSRAFALMGDVTFLHDANGLVLGPDEPRPDLTIVVVNDDGGSIFAMLEQGDPSYADRYDRLFGTPHGVDIASLCAATRTPHWRVDSLAELEHALANPNGGIEVVEVAVRRDNRRDLDARIRALGTTGG